MGLVRLPCFFNCVQRIERYSTTSSKMIKKWNWWSFHISEEEEEPYLRVKCMFVRCPTYLHLYPCTLPTAPVSRSFGLRSSYEIDILDTDQRPRNKSLRLLNQFKLSMWNFCRGRCGALHNLLYCPVTINLLCPIVKLEPLFTLESKWLRCGGKVKTKTLALNFYNKYYLTRYILLSSHIHVYID